MPALQLTDDAVDEDQMSIFDSDNEDMLHADELLHRVTLPCDRNLTFYIRGAPFQVGYKKAVGDTFRLHIGAVLGYLPFSAESRQNRGALLRIIHAAQSLPTARFGVNSSSEIVVFSEFLVTDIQPPIFIFAPLVAMLQEARPFMDLIGEHL